MSIESRFEQAKKKNTDINEHLDTLYALAQECEHITEFGTRHGESTNAFLAAKPKKLMCYDVDRKPEVAQLERLKGDTDFNFFQQSTLEVEIEETDLLFIDTLHTYKQVKGELAEHPKKVKKYLVFHDTVTFGYKDEVDDGTLIQKRGINAAIREFMDANPEWVIKHHFNNNNGLTVLEKQN